mgnify:CR=1 FL=1
MRNLVLFTSMILSFWGCSNDKDFGGLENIGWNEKPLQITTRILTTKSTNFIQEFKEGSMLGLQITSGTVDDLYNGISTYKNVSVKAYRVNGKIRWQQSPEVILDSNEATIYAYYPYQEDINFNARQIPVKLAPNALETDELYVWNPCDRTKSSQQYLATCITQHESCPIAYIFPVEPKQRQDRCLYYKFRSSRK